VTVWLHANDKHRIITDLVSTNLTAQKGS